MAASPRTTPWALKWGWYGGEVANARPCASTYEYYSTCVPAIPATKYQDLAFLADPDVAVIPKYGHLGDAMADYTHPNEQTRAVNATKMNALLATDPDVPPSFVRFMTSKALQSNLPSCTACYTYLGDPVTIRELNNMRIVMFYRDQQDCLAWYLVLDGEHAGRVVGSPFILGTGADDDEWDVDAFVGDSALCATSFDEFLYRMWVENHVWFNTSTPPAVAEACQWYQRQCHYVAQQARATGEQP
ncbi:hypothetical protein H310_07654 [Aphanomyces invadans]|uniref:Uncharacterized protein n=1 Tax=Aphanomyces invadans TaxID=157072 RepID=A0A024U3S5_9STRA|nr:hypothetical protein H310_07654 [Aphanomyces invadans]ETW00273.1 hypothetical protein H310_07654 [Aphanomyces invadans]|eukprot:XP_008871298.1 hypothetical protein H310_07654 [Aphanomyces invadans]